MVLSESQLPKYQNQTSIVRVKGEKQSVAECSQHPLVLAVQIKMLDAEPLSTTLDAFFRAPISEKLFVFVPYHVL